MHAQTYTIKKKYLNLPKFTVKVHKNRKVLVFLTLTTDNRTHPFKYHSQNEIVTKLLIGSSRSSQDVSD